MDIERKAFLTAFNLHKNQWYGDEPYIIHLFDVVQILRNTAGISAPQDLAIGWLHDTVEDTGYTLNGIRQEFGPWIAKIVEALTDPPGNRKERRQAMMARLKKTPEAIPYKLVDRLANMHHCVRTKNAYLLKMYQKEKDFLELQEHYQYPDYRWKELKQLMKVKI